MRNASMQMLGITPLLQASIQRWRAQGRPFSLIKFLFWSFYRFFWNCPSFLFLFLSVCPFLERWSAVPFSNFDPPKQCC